MNEMDITPTKASDIASASASVTASAPALGTNNVHTLNEVSEKIPKLLQTAGTAIQSLTSTPQTPLKPSSKQSASLAARKEQFISQSTEFYDTLLAVRTALLAQAAELKKAGLKISEEGEEDGLGGLDIGYLNGRVRDVGIVKEGELVKDAKASLERLVERQEKKIKEEGDAMVA